MATLYENSTWAWDGIVRSIYSNSYWYAQTFTPQTTHDITSVVLSLGRPSGESPGTVTVSIRETTTGKPSGDDLCSGTTDGNTVPEVGWPTPIPEEREITFSTNPTLTLGTKYAIVVRALSGSSSNKLYWSASTSSVYANGDQCFSNGGSSWILYNDRELWFEEYGNPPSPPSKPTNPTPSDAATSVDFSGLELSWDDGGGADTFDVYMGPSGNLSLISSAQAGTTLTVDTADVPWGETIYWRIDSTNAQGTTTGDTWSFDTVIIRSVKLGANGAFIVVAAKDGVYLSTDSGANWTRKTPDSVEDTDWTKGICSSTGTYIIVVSSANAIYRSANSGTSWAEITPAGGDTFSVNKMATSDDGQFMVIVGQNSTDATESCYISTDYGATWTAKKPVAASIEWTDCDISNDGAVIAASTSSYFYASFDSGATWMEQGMASTAEVWEGLSISGDGEVGLVANTNDNDEFFIGTNTELFSEATWAESALTSAGRALLDDADAAAQTTTLGLGIGDSPQFTGVNIGHASDTTLTRVSSGDLNIEDNIIYRAGGTDVPVTDGGTGASSLTDHGILLGSGTGAITPLGVAANGKIPIGSAGADPVLAAITQGSANQVVVTNGAGSITLSTPQDIHTGATPTFAGLTLVNAVTEFSTDTAMTDNSDSAVPTEKAVKAYVDGGGGGIIPTVAFKTITGITNDVVADAADDILTLASADAKLTIVGTTATDTITFSVIEGQIDHDALTNFAANEHVDHTSITLTAGTGLTGGGDISANRTFAVDRVLEDLDTLGPNAADSEFLVGTAAGALAWESGATVRTSLGVGIGDSPQFTGIELGHASDTTLTRVSAGIVAIEGTSIAMVGDAPTAHTHDSDTLQLDAVNSDGGAFGFNTTGAVTFNQSIASANYGATNKLTACATNAGALDFSAIDKTLTVDETQTIGNLHTDARAATWLAANHETTYTHGDIATNTTHRSSDGSDHTFIDQSVVIAASPTFTGISLTGNLNIIDGKKISWADGANETAYLSMSDVAGYLELYSDHFLYVKPDGDVDDFFQFRTINHVPTIGTVGNCNLKITASSGEISFANENLTTTGNITCEELILGLGGTQDYKFTSRGGSTPLAIQSQNAATPFELMCYQKDAGDSEANNVILGVYGQGVPGDIDPGHGMRMMWAQSESRYRLHTFETGTGTDQPLTIYAGIGNGGQILLQIDGDVEIGVGPLDFVFAMGNSTKNPTTDAPVDWVEIKIAGTTRYLPAYAAS